MTAEPGHGMTPAGIPPQLPPGGAPRALAPWCFVVVALNVLLATGPGHAGDMEFWANWIGQLQTRGFHALQANYPPFYMLWLWLLARFYTFWNLVPAQGELLRMLINTPVLLAHAGLLAFAARQLRRGDADARGGLWMLAFVALNPVLLVDGPMWGQVDALFCLFLVLALGALIEGRYLLLVFPLLALALLTKFQTICAAPVLLALIWQRRRAPRLWLGLLPAALVAGLLLLPYVLADSLPAMIRQAYLQASSLYPLATMNGGNLWYALDLNFRPDSLFLPEPGLQAAGWMRAFTPKWLGIAAFALWCAWLLADSLRHRASDRLWRNALLSATGFFVLLPGMHERYLVPAAVIALAGAARHATLRPHALALTVFSALNMLVVLRPSGGLLLHGLGAATLLFMLWACLPGRFAPGRAVRRLPTAVWAATALLVWLLPIALLVRAILPDADGWVGATRLAGVGSTQEWGALQIDRAVNGGELNINGQRFARGFGTHANGRISVPVPAGAREFCVQVGLNTSGAQGEAQFSIAADGNPRWRSERMTARQDAAQTCIGLQGARIVQLSVDALGSNRGDHANWANPRFRLDGPAVAPAP
ncbi:MAG: NPCBM/NEW2 domain-containing protein [Candidatus Dactylopiibacterium sp.]|nr:NPCBM/NEW2 domain-containing protein [Candidatus Dactylopiibacterium sp.]